jgi:hypothetical protein
MVVVSCWVKAHWCESYYYVFSASQAIVKMCGAYHRLSDPLIFQSLNVVKTNAE